MVRPQRPASEPTAEPEGALAEEVSEPRIRSIRSVAFGKRDTRTLSEKRRDAADAKWERTDPREGTMAARTAFMARFEKLAGSEGTEAERARRVEALIRRHFRRMAHRSVQSRRQRQGSK